MRTISSADSARRQFYTTASWPVGCLMRTASLLDRLQRVKQAAPGRWIARCPAHQDRSPSLSIRELDDGRTLLKCFGGCGAIDVLDSLGLTWDALFPQREKKADPRSFSQSHSRIPARDLLEIISMETSVVAIVAADLLANKTISEIDWKRLAQAASRIGHARDMVNPARVPHG